MDVFGVAETVLAVDEGGRRAEPVMERRRGASIDIGLDAEAFLDVQAVAKRLVASRVSEKSRDPNEIDRRRVVCEEKSEGVVNADVDVQDDLLRWRRSLGEQAGR